MQAQQSKPANTSKPTVGQIMAAKRAKKREQEIERLAKAKIGNRSCDRNKASEREFIQYKNCIAMREGELHDEEVNINDSIKNLNHYQALAYGHSAVSAGIYEQLIRAMRVVSAIYKDADLRDATNQAQAALEKSQSMVDASPNQRRVLLRPLLILAAYSEHYAAIIPAKTCEQIGSYCAAVQFVLYTTAYYDRPLEHIEATNRVIRGESIRTIAKEYGVKENLMRIFVLDAAWCLYKMADAISTVEQPDSIPKLRGKEWQPFANPEYLQSVIHQSTERFLIPFESYTGISLIDYRKFRSSLVKIEKKHNAA